MAQLNEEQGYFIVRLHAEMLSYGQIQHEVREAYSLHCTKQQIAYYDPGNSTGGGPSEELCKYYEGRRAEILESIESIPIASPFYQLRQLQFLVERHAASDDPKAANAVRGCIKLAADLRGQLRKKVDLDITSGGLLITSGYHDDELAVAAYRDVLGSLPSPSPANLLAPGDGEVSPEPEPERVGQVVEVDSDTASD